MKLKIADFSDVDDIIVLHSKYQVDSIAVEDKKDGFVTGQDKNNHFIKETVNVR